ncbi:MAG: hypothetical protein ACREJB_12405, partial [Planctomycetaceae bacterium]
MDPLAVSPEHRVARRGWKARPTNQFLCRLIAVALALASPAIADAGETLDGALRDLAGRISEIAQSQKARDIAVGPFLVPPAAPETDRIPRELSQLLKDQSLADPPLSVAARPRSGLRVTGRLAETEGRPWGLVLHARIEGPLGQSLHEWMSPPITDEHDLCALLGVTGQLPTAVPLTPTDEVRKFLGDGAITVLAALEDIEAFRIEPRPAAAGERSIGGFPITATAKPDRALAGRLAAILLDESTYLFDQRKRCAFEPGVALRLRSGGRTLTVLLCFRCHELMVIAQDEQGREMHRAVEDFDAAAPELAALVQPLFPDDEALQELPTFPEGADAALNQLATLIDRWLQSQAEQAATWQGLDGPNTGGRDEILSRRLREAISRRDIETGFSTWAVRAEYKIEQGRGGNTV